jgi:hypothetical protein
VEKKQCKYCEKWYPETSFGVALTTASKVYRRRKCRFCYRDTKQILINRIHQWIIDYKVQRGCSNCGIIDPRVLDLHHSDESKKTFTVAYFRRALGFERIKREVEKCEVLCANCHRILHWEKRQQVVIQSS